MPEWAWTLIAQLINVAILVILLRRFLYQPVRRMLATRREKVLKEMDEASAAKADAEKARARHEERRKGAEAEAEEIVAAAREKARQEVEAAAERAKAAAAEEREKALEALKRETGEAERAVRNRELDLAMTLSRKIVESAATAALAGVFAEDLAAKVKELRSEELPPLAGSAGPDAAQIPVLLRVSHDPGGEVVERIRRAFADRLGRNVSIDMQKEESLICGAEAECKSLVIKSHLAQRLLDAREALENKISGPDTAAPRT